MPNLFIIAGPNGAKKNTAMKNKKAEELFAKISLGIRAAIALLYEDAKKNGAELIISARLNQSSSYILSQSL